MRTHVALSAALVLCSCAKSQTEQPTTTAQSEADQPGSRDRQGMGAGMMGASMAGICPTAVANTTARAADVDGGAAIAFTGTGDIAEVRRRAAQMAETYNRHQSGGHGFMMRMGPGTMGPGTMGPGTMGSGMHGSQGDMPGGMTRGGMMMSPSTARSEDIEQGARLVLTPRAPAQLPTLRQHTQQMAAAMAAQQCPMMDRAEQGNSPTDAPRQGSNP